MRPNCHICKEPSPFLLHKDNYDLYKCQKCNLVFVYPQPTLEWLKKDLYSLESGFQSHRAENLAKTNLDSRRRKLLKYLLKNKPNASILDVGCGGGHFLYWAKINGFIVQGVELNKRLADSAEKQGIPVYTGLITEMSKERKFDVVILGEVIEHVTNPREIVEQCKKMLNDGGLFVISTPNLNCLWSITTFQLYKLFKIPWSSVTPPYHLFQFDNYNLDILLSECLFEKVDAWYLPQPSLKYELGSMHLLKRWKKTKSIGDFIYMIFSFSLYVPIYIISLLLHPFSRYNFGMTHIYRKFQ